MPPRALWLALLARLLVTDGFKRVGLRDGAHQLVTQVTYGLAHGSKARAPEERCLLPLVPPVAAP